MFTVGAAANAGRAMLMRISGQRIVARLRENMYGAALQQEVEYVERGEGDVLSRLSVDSNVVGDSLTQNLSDGLRSIIMSSAGLGAMFYISPKLTFLMLAIVPPISLGVVFYGRYLKRLSTRTQEALGEMTKVAQESLSALRTVQSYNAVPQEQQKFHEKVGDVLALARKEAIASGIFFGSTGWSGNVTLLGLLGYGGTMVSQGQISVGDLTSLLLYTVYIILRMPISLLSTPYPNMKLEQTSIMRGVGAGERIFELLDRHPAIPPYSGLAMDPARRGPVRFEGVSFQYPSRPGVEILKNLDLEVKVGESVALVGRSGSGKSSINALLLRYYDPVKGKVTFDGQDIREFNPASWRSIIGVVPQDPVLFTGTIASNIAYGNEEATQEQIEAAAREANCEFIWGMPKGFDTEIGRLSLSGGQRQRLAIARALLKKPAILALDEATSSLDATSEHRVNDAIDKILRSRQTTCLIVAHRLSTIARAEKIVVLEDGHVVEAGTYRQLVNREGSRFRALMAAQLNAAAGSAPAEKAFGEFAQQITKLSQLGAELETAEIVNRLRKMMDVEDERLEKEIEGIKVLQDEVIKKDVIEHLKIAVENDVSDLIDQLVAEQVTILLPDHIPSALLDELARHKRELDEVEVDLHNSESRLANAQIRTSDLTEQLRTIQRADKTVSQHFPADLQGLIAMDDASVKSLMRYYALSDISDSQDRNLNRLMLFLGLSYQLVRSPTLSPHRHTQT
ncbi:hypothetical protein EVJ58_g7010 [Rhodofomes roseus]|uniref:ATP-binding cassette subfamily B protein n=1 Tax=Rhodofomes roseus TaxID=34475 RepID=A0A4Y9Y4R6_9APHY|nr:hypothetical protein EVJ58_g7010 [Rhodofomes roseus]